jgi:hypothetical protein
MIDATLLRQIGQLGFFTPNVEAVNAEVAAESINDIGRALLRMNERLNELEAARVIEPAPEVPRSDVAAARRRPAIPSRRGTARKRSS